MLKILHVDRSEMFRKVLREMVYRCGHSIESVATQAEALEKIASNPVDLLITSLELDDGNAEELIRSVSERNEASSPAKDIPIIVLTSTDSLELREKFFALGVVDYMLKGEVTEAQFRRYFDALAAEDELSTFMRGLRVAVLDDSQMILKIVHRILSLNGFESIHLFADPLTLLSSGEKFDIYILDMVLPNMSGEQVVTRLRREQSQAIIISVSRFTGEKPLSNILLAGADDYIHKPFDAAGLITRLKINVRSYLYRRRLEALAITDGLTGLYNHRYSFERLGEEIQKAHRYRRPLSFLIFDIDNFKKVNDTWGHIRGDEVLVQVSQAIKGCLRSVDLVGRYGGEEFMVLLPEIDLEAAKTVADKILTAVRNLRFSESALLVTISGGAVQLREGEDLESLVHRGDLNLYRAKADGKDRVVGS